MNPPTINASLATLAVRPYEPVQVTAWWRLDKVKGFRFNHIEMGWSQLERPSDPVGPRWSKGVWHRSHAELREPGRWGAPLLHLLQAPPSGAASDVDD